MTWRRITVTLLGIAATLLSAGRARAKGDNAGSLGSGGRARGDISKDPGETDRITVDLAAGATLSVVFSASFHAEVSLAGQDGAPVDLGPRKGSAIRAKGIPVPTTGTYAFAVSSTDGSQGLYSLKVTQSWPRVIAVSGSGTSVVDVGMPAGGKIACVVRDTSGAAGEAQILSLRDPGGTNILPQAIGSRGAVARLAPTAAPGAGVYQLTLGTSGASAWSARVTREAPPVPQARLVLTNGLNTISFAADGVGGVFLRHCSSCHSWASTYGGVRAYVFGALGRMQSGSMPPSGGVSANEVALVREWVHTGRQP
jgi:hypothetical protein